LQIVDRSLDGRVRASLDRVRRRLQHVAHLADVQSVGEQHETHGTATLYVDDQVVAEGPIRTQPGHFALCGEGLSIGRDTGDAVSKEYTPHFPFSGGRILEIEVNIGDDVYIDVERDFAAAMARD